MVRTIVSHKTHYVTVDAFDINGDSTAVCRVNDLSFMDAADWAQSAVNYFRFAIADHADWVSIQIEINTPMDLIEVIEIGAERV